VRENKCVLKETECVLHWLMVCMFTVYAAKQLSLPAYL
jgi:hypothetical protein